MKRFNTSDIVYYLTFKIIIIYDYFIVLNMLTNAYAHCINKFKFDPSRIAFNFVISHTFPYLIHIE